MIKYTDDTEQEEQKINTNYRPIIAYSEKHGWIKEVYNDAIRRTKYTKNEIRVYEDDVCEIDFYDILGNYRDTGTFSYEDLNIVLPHKWYKDNVGYMCATINKEKVRFHTLIPHEKILDHIDGNKLNNTRENLQDIPHSVNIARIHNKMPNSHGVTGISFTSCHKWMASIEVNKKKITKNYDTKEEAILQRYIWEINYWGKNAPQIDNIRQIYPRLIIGTTPNIKINDDVQLVKEILEKLAQSPYCPCRIDHTPDTKCMCKEFRDMEEGTCHCGLYIKTKTKKENN